MPVDSNNTELKLGGIFYTMHVMVLTYGEPKKGYLNLTLGNLWATQPIAFLIWPPLQHSVLMVYSEFIIFYFIFNSYYYGTIIFSRTFLVIMTHFARCNLIESNSYLSTGIT